MSETVKIVALESAHPHIHSLIRQTQELDGVEFVGLERACFARSALGASSLRLRLEVEPRRSRSGARSGGPCRRPGREAGAGHRRCLSIR